MTPEGEARIAKPISQLAYKGSARDLYFILIPNVLLTIVTLGVYRFWARTKLRRYVWSVFGFNGEPFAYLGTSIELFKSFLKFSGKFMLPALILPSAVTFWLHKTPYEPFGELVSSMATIYFIVLYSYARYTGLRYRLSRSSWRGIRGQLNGSAREAMWLQFKNTILNILSLYLYKPMADIAYFSYIMNRFQFGSQPFVYRGPIEELQQHYFICWLLVVPTFSLSLLSYQAKFYAHIAKYTRFGEMEFRCNITTRELVFFVLGNILLIVFTLGLGYPYVYHRRLSLFASKFKYRGELNLTTISQAGARSGAEGGELNLGGDDIGF